MNPPTMIRFAKLPQFTQLKHIRAAVLSDPAIERLLRDAMLATDFGRSSSRLHLVKRVRESSSVARFSVSRARERTSRRKLGKAAQARHPNRATGAPAEPGSR